MIEVCLLVSLRVVSFSIVFVIAKDNEDLEFAYCKAQPKWNKIVPSIGKLKLPISRRNILKFALFSIQLLKMDSLMDLNTLSWLILNMEDVILSFGYC